MPTDIHRTNETKTTRPDTWTHLRARKHDNTSAFGEHYANTHPNTTTPNITFKILKQTSDTLRLHIEEAYAIQTKSPQLNRRDEHLGMASSSNTHYILYWQYTLHWQHTQLTTHSTGNTLYRQNALPTTHSPTDSTLSRTRQQHLHPSHNLQSPPSYVHSYSRTTGFLSLYYMYFAP